MQVCINNYSITLQTEILRHLKHPNIIQFHGVVIDSPKSEHYIVTG